MLTPHQIRSFTKGLVSRFLSGMVVEIERPSRETRRSLIKRLADSRGLFLEEPAIELVASRCIGSVREIQGALDSIECPCSGARRHQQSGRQRDRLPGVRTCLGHLATHHARPHQGSGLHPTASGTGGSCRPGSRPSSLAWPRPGRLPCSKADRLQLSGNRPDAGPSQPFLSTCRCKTNRDDGRGRSDRSACQARGDRMTAVSSSGNCWTDCSTPFPTLDGSPDRLVRFTCSGPS